MLVSDFVVDETNPSHKELNLWSYLQLSAMEGVFISGFLLDPGFRHQICRDTV